MKICWMTVRQIDRYMYLSLRKGSITREFACSNVNLRSFTFLLENIFFIEFTNILWSSETYRRTTSLIGDPLKTNMPYRRPTCLIRDRLTSSETDMPHRRPTYFIDDRHASSETYMPKRRLAFLIGDPAKIGDRHAWSETISDLRAS